MTPTGASRPLILVTRPAQDADTLIRALEDRGCTALVQPMLRMVWLPQAVDLAGVQALLATSANGVRALAAQPPDICRQARTLPLCAIGPATAAAARTAGFATVHTAAGDIPALVRLAGEACAPGAVLVHLAGRTLAGGLAHALRKAGFQVCTRIIYDACEATALSADVRCALEQRNLAGVTLYSPRTAAVFVRLVRAAGLEASLDSVAAYCLAPSVAAALAGVVFRSVAHAARPEQGRLLQLLP